MPGYKIYLNGIWRNWIALTVMFKILEKRLFKILNFLYNVQSFDDGNEWIV